MTTDTIAVIVGEREAVTWTVTKHVVVPEISPEQMAMADSLIREIAAAMFNQRLTDIFPAGQSLIFKVPTVNRFGGVINLDNFT
jgi:hypothetical protein